MVALDAVLGGLQQHGLLAHTASGGGSVQGGGGAGGIWRLTDFGAQVRELLITIGETVGKAGPEPAQ
jgi:hypothetical protein